jgi:hypothetical protein
MENVQRLNILPIMKNAFTQRYPSVRLGVVRAAAAPPTSPQLYYSSPTPSTSLFISLS